MEETRKISERQLTVLIFISLLSPLIRAAPVTSVFFAGKAAWLSPIAGLVMGYIVYAVMSALTKKAPEGAGLAELSITALGGVFGRAYCVLIALWLTFYCGSIARGACERLLSALYPNGGLGLLLPVIVLTGVVIAFGSVRGLARMSELALPIVAAVFIIVSLAAFTDVDVTKLLPVTYKDAGGVILGGLPLFDILGLHVYFLFLLGNVKSGASKRFPFIILASITAFVVTAVTLGSVGEHLALKLQNAFFVVVRNVKIAGVIDRIESLVVGIWVITDITMTASLIFIAAEIWRTIFGTQKRGIYAVPTGALALIAAFLVSPDAFTFQRWSELIIPAVNTVITTFIIPAVTAVGVLRSRSMQRSGTK